MVLNGGRGSSWRSDYLDGEQMTLAIFALVGTLVGVLGTLATQLIGARTENLRSRRDNLRLTCADFASAIARIKELACEVMEQRADSDPDAWNSIRAAHLEARVHYERLRLVSSSMEVQESGRYALRYAYGLIQQAAGDALRKDELERGPLGLLHESLLELYAAVRRELGITQPDEIFREPDEWLGPTYRNSGKNVT
jgi:hypothetical protein